MALYKKGPGLCLDGYDGMLVRFAPIDDGITCISKLVEQGNCPRPEMRYNTRYSSTDGQPLNFFLESANHSCKGIYWHVHLNLGGDIGNLTQEMVSGSVQQPLDRIKFSATKAGREYITAIALALGFSSLQAYVDMVGSPVDTRTMDRKKVDPFTTEWRRKDTMELSIVVEKPCGYASGDSESAMKIAPVREQIIAKLADIHRLYPELQNLDLSEVSQLGGERVSCTFDMTSPKLHLVRERAERIAEQIRSKMK